MKITFLGTGTSQGVPVIACSCPVCQSKDPKDRRLRSSVLVEITGDGGSTDTVILIDTGPDFRYQMLRSRVTRLDAILFTHEHRDHIAGLDDVRAYNFIQQKSMDLYGEPRVLRALHHSFPYIFAERKYPGIPRVNFHQIDNRPFRIHTTEIIPIRALHYRLPVLGFRIGDFAYITDANSIPTEEIKKIRGVPHFTICALRRKEHISHFNLDQALGVIEQVQPGRAYLTHISHLMGLVKETESELPENVSLAYDTQVIEI
jgi:phosphoribosyl 1,2-cyclic phosphate phosphodiesterase